MVVYHFGHDHRPHHAEEREQDGKPEGDPEQTLVRLHETHYPAEQPDVERFAFTVAHAPVSVNG